MQVSGHLYFHIFYAVRVSIKLIESGNPEKISHVTDIPTFNYENE